MKVGVMGGPYHSHILVDQLNRQGVEAFYIDVAKTRFPRKLWRADIIHGYSMPTSYKGFALSKLLAKKTVHHWIGSDVLRVLTEQKTRSRAKLAHRFIDQHLALSDFLVEELSEVDIPATRLPAVPRNLTFDMPPLPPKLAVVTYLPDHKHEFYGSNVVYSLAEEFPEIDFLVVAGSGKGQRQLPNIQYLGHVSDMNSVYARTHVLLRMPQHDGQSLMVLEALSKGRHVIYNYKSPYCYHATDLTGAREALTELSRNPSLNVKGPEYVAQEFHEDRIMAQLIRIYESLLGKSK